MGYVRRRHTSTKFDVLGVARKEIQYVFLNEIVSNIEKYSIPHAMVINFDQAPLKIVLCGKSTLAKKNSSTVAIAAAAAAAAAAGDNRSVTASFSITLTREFLPM